MTTVSAVPHIPSEESCTERERPQSKTAVEDKMCVEKEVETAKEAEEEEEEEQLELDWRSMLEMFPRPRTYSQTAKYLAKKRMGMMGSAA